MEIKPNQKYWQGRKVLVTGHEGFLGSWLAKQLADYGARVVGFDKIKNRPLSVLNDIRKKVICIEGDIVNFNLIEKVIARHRPQTIFHLAAEAIVGEANRNPVNTFHSNIRGTWNLLEAVRHSPSVESIVAASSDKAYGSHKSLPYREDTALIGEHPYDVSKSCADLVCRSYFKTFNVPVCVTRCGNIYGPGDTNFSRIVPDAVCSILKDKQFVIRSDGKFTRDYIYVKDVVAGYLMLAENLKKLKLEGEAFNLSCERPLSVLALFHKIAEACQRKALRPKILNKANHEIRHQYLSSQRARRILGWRPVFTTEDGLRETVEWYRQYLKR